MEFLVDAIYTTRRLCRAMGRYGTLETLPIHYHAPYTKGLATAVLVISRLPSAINLCFFFADVVCPILSLWTVVLHVLAMLQGTPCASRAESEVQLSRKQGDNV